MPRWLQERVLTFRGTNEAKVVDRDNRVRITLSATQAARLWRELGQVLTDEERAV